MLFTYYSHSGSTLGFGSGRRGAGLPVLLFGGVVFCDPFGDVIGFTSFPLSSVLCSSSPQAENWEKCFDIWLQDSQNKSVKLIFSPIIILTVSGDFICITLRINCFILFFRRLPIFFCNMLSGNYFWRILIFIPIFFFKLQKKGKTAFFISTIMYTDKSRR